MVLVRVFRKALSPRLAGPYDNNDEEDSMQKYLITVASAVGLLLGTATMAAAQDKSAPSTRSPAIDSPGAGAIQRDGGGFGSYTVNKDMFAGATTADGMAPDSLLGASVASPSGDEIGEVVDLLVNSENQIEQAIVEVGGFLGIGSQTVAVKLDTLQQQPDAGEGFVTSLTEEELKNLPEYRLVSGTWVRDYE